MKKLLLLLSFLAVFIPKIHSQEFNYLPQNAKDTARSNASLKLDAFLAQYPFPENHHNSLERAFLEFESNLAVVEHKFADQPQIKIQKTDSLKRSYHKWRQDQSKAYNNALRTWKEMHVKYDLKAEIFKTKIFNYNFYSSLKNTSETEISKIENLAQSDLLKKATRIIARKEMQFLISQCKNLQNLDSVALKHAGKSLYIHLKSKIEDKLKTHAPMSLARTMFPRCQYALKVGRERQDSLIVQKKKLERQTLISQAKALGIGTKKINTIIQLMDKRTNDLEAAKHPSKNAEAVSDLFETSQPKPRHQIKKEFAQDLATLINQTEFAKLFGKELTKSSLNKTQKKMNELSQFDGLTKKQAAQIKALVKPYYFNQEVIMAYFLFDKKLQRQKLSALNYHFEKDYQTLMKALKLPINPVKKTHKRTFQWD